VIVGVSALTCAVTSADCRQHDDPASPVLRVLHFSKLPVWRDRPLCGAERGAIKGRGRSGRSGPAVCPL